MAQGTTHKNANWSRLGAGMFVANDGVHSLWISGSRGEWAWKVRPLSEPRVLAEGTAASVIAAQHAARATSHEIGVAS